MSRSSRRIFRKSSPSRLQGQEIITDRLFTDPVTNRQIEKYNDVEFFKHQHRLALRNLGKIAAHSIKESIAVGGYAGFAKASDDHDAG